MADAADNDSSLLLPNEAGRGRPPEKAEKTSTASDNEGVSHRLSLFVREERALGSGSWPFPFDTHAAYSQALHVPWAETGVLLGLRWRKEKRVKEEEKVRGKEVREKGGEEKVVEGDHYIWRSKKVVVWKSSDIKSGIWLWNGVIKGTEEEKNRGKRLQAKVY